MCVCCKTYIRSYILRKNFPVEVFSNLDIYIYKHIGFGLIEMQAEISLCCRFCKTNLKNSRSLRDNTWTCTKWNSHSKVPRLSLAIHRYVEKVGVTIMWTNYYFQIFVMHPHESNSFFGGKAYTSCIYSIFPICMKSNALEKSINNSVVSRVFACTPSINQWLVRICETWFFLKLFLFFLRIFSTSACL